jgi:hypothetical protein
MKKKISFVVFFLLLFAGFLLRKNFESFKKKAYVYTLDCRVLNTDKTIIFEGGGGMCEFLKDGSFIRFLKTSETDYTISRVSANDVVLWVKPYIAHHMMTASKDQKLLYLLSVDRKIWRGKQTKFDTVIALDSETGKEIAHWSAYDVKEELEKQHGDPPPRRTNIPPEHQYVPLGIYEDEFTHFNSINLIPDEVKSYLQADIIVNTGRGVELFFTKELRLVAYYWVDPLWSVNSHDAQITPEGNLLLYKNWDHSEKGASLEMYDLTTKKRVWLYDRSPEGKVFGSNKFGSVQLLEDGGFLYSDMDTGGHFTEVGDDGKKRLEYYSPEIDPRDKLPRAFIRVKKMAYKQMSKKMQGLLDQDLDQFMFSIFYKRFL